MRLSFDVIVSIFEMIAKLFWLGISLAGLLLHKNAKSFNHEVNSDENKEQR